jgi:hypothetical protein
LAFEVTTGGFSGSLPAAIMSALIAYCDRDAFAGSAAVRRRDRRADFGASGAGSVWHSCAAVARIVQSSGLPK